MVQPPKELNKFQSLTQIVEALRGPQGCPWDKEQTHQTLTPYAIEEAHELAEAIESNDTGHMIEELGDLLLQVMIHAEIGRQSGTFTIEDVIFAVSEKMVRRHPHVFGEVKAETSTQVLENWAKIKDQEKPDSDKQKTGFAVPVNMPALQRAQKIGGKTKKFNFDWPSIDGVIEKMDEEVAELKQALKESDKPHQEHELGDLLFTLAQLARHIDTDCEQTLRKTNNRFEARFTKMQEIATDKQLKFSQLQPDQLEALWNEAKSLLE